VCSSSAGFGKPINMLSAFGFHFQILGYVIMLVQNYYVLLGI